MPEHIDPDRLREAVADVPDLDWSAPDLAGLSPTERLDNVLAVLSRMPIQDRAGFTSYDLAELAGVSEPTVRRLFNRALARARRRAAKLLAERDS